MKAILLIALVGLGYAAAKSSSEEAWRKELEEKDSYTKRLPEALQALGQCIVLDSMIQTNNSEDIAKECVEGSTLQSLLPAFYALVNVQETECLEEQHEALRAQPEMYNKYLNMATEFLVQKKNSKDFCNFLDKTLIPSMCAFRRACSTKKDRQALQAVPTIYYSTQQFLNNGIDTKFVCKRTRININPELYKFGTKFDPEINFLSKDIDCSKYPRPPFPKPTTTVAPETTTAVPKTTTSHELPLFDWDCDDYPDSPECSGVKLNVDPDEDPDTSDEIRRVPRAKSF